MKKKLFTHYTLHANTKSMPNGGNTLSLSISDVSAFVSEALSEINRVNNCEEILGTNITRSGDLIRTKSLRLTQKGFAKDFAKLDLLCSSVISRTRDIQKKNVSFVSAILHATLEGYATMTTAAKTRCVEALVHRCQQMYRTDYKKNLYKKHTGLTAKAFGEILSDNFSHKTIMKYIADIMFVNLFAINVSEEKIEYIGMHPYDPNSELKNVIILMFGDGYCDLIHDSQNLFFTNGHQIMILMREYLSCKNSECEEDTSNDKVCNSEENGEENGEENSEENSGNDDILQTQPKMKMTKGELVKLAQAHGIVSTKASAYDKNKMITKTKAELINEIIDVLKKS